ncbi:MAG: hypothetical protein JNK81_05900, partial [Anaerolineales bacterium]|nr:hypothetical protein [Anaerolineales bacterium]
MAQIKKTVRKGKKTEEVNNIESTGVEKPVEATISVSQKPIIEAYPIKPKGLLFIIALILGWLSDFLFWEQALGVNVPLFLTLC